MAMLTMLKDLAQRAGRLLGVSERGPAHTTSVVSDRFDEMDWRETFDQATALRTFADDLNERFDYTTDLIRDIFLGAYKTFPQVHDAADMHPSRRVNHRVVSTLLDSPEFGELRRETAGDSYAAAMAVLSQESTLRRVLEQTADAQRAAEQAAATEQEAADAAQALTDALELAGDQVDENGELPGDVAESLEGSVAAAEHAAAAARDAENAAQQSLAAAVPLIRGSLRKAADAAAQEAREASALIASWGVEPGQLQRMSFEQRARLAERLHTIPMSQFVDLIGRYRTMAAGERTNKIQHAPGEVVGLALGDDLTRMIPTEAANLAIPQLRAVFAARWAEQQLMIYDTHGDDTTGKGAIIACIDCSGSMRGAREAWTKSCALAMLDQARAAKRDFVGILFSNADQVRVFHFPAGRTPAIEDVLDLAELFWGGGTDFEAPLDAATNVLEAQFNDDGKQRGDIVIMTDGRCSVTDTWRAGWTERKARLGFRLFGIAIASRPNALLTELCDNVRSVTDFADLEQAADLFRTI